MRLSVNRHGEWFSATPHARVDGVWRVCRGWVNVHGYWMREQYYDNVVTLIQPYKLVPIPLALAA